MVILVHPRDASDYGRMVDASLSQLDQNSLKRISASLGELLEPFFLMTLQRLAKVLSFKLTIVSEGICAAVVVLPRTENELSKMEYPQICSEIETGIQCAVELLAKDTKVIGLTGSLATHWKDCESSSKSNFVELPETDFLSKQLSQLCSRVEGVPLQQGFVVLRSVPSS